MNLQEFKKRVDVAEAHWSESAMMAIATFEARELIALVDAVGAFVNVESDDLDEAFTRVEKAYDKLKGG